MTEIGCKKKQQILGIDASNIRGGGGVTHLVEVLKNADPITHGFSKIIVWGGQKTLDKIEDRSWLEKSYQPILNKNILYRTFWQCFKLSGLARQTGCSLLFVPGGSYSGNFRPMATFSQNLLPFEWHEIKRYGFSMATVRLILLHMVQSYTFRKAEGLIFLTEFAKEVVMRSIKTTRGTTTIIPHGIDQRFLCAPRPQLPINEYSANRPFRILYVSMIDMYKHQWQVAEAVTILRQKGLPVMLELVGPAYHPALKKLQRTLDHVDPGGKFIYYLGAVPYEELHVKYSQADISVFASSCETFGQILTEAMCAGLPIACSNKSAMRELLGDGGLYFDPEDPQNIAVAIEKLINSPELRARLAVTAFERAHSFSWKQCAEDTFHFLNQVRSNSPA